MTTQANSYQVIDSIGRPTNIWLIASNIKEAYKEARKIEKQIGSRYYKLQRCYNGRVRGSQGY